MKRLFTSLFVLYAVCVFGYTPPPNRLPKLVGPPEAIANMTLVVAGGSGGGGDDPATGTYYPDAELDANGVWYTNGTCNTLYDSCGGTCWNKLDETGVHDCYQVGGNNAADYIEVSLEEITGDITSVRLTIYGYNSYSTPNLPAVEWTPNGWTNTHGPTDIEVGTGTGEGTEVTIDYTSLSYSGTSDHRVKIYYHEGGWSYIDYVKVTANP